jgi:hypothetical protein
MSRAAAILVGLGLVGLGMVALVGLRARPSALTGELPSPVRHLETHAGRRRTRVPCFATTQRIGKPPSDEGSVISEAQCKSWCKHHRPVHRDLGAFCCEYIVWEQGHVQGCTWTDGIGRGNGTRPRVRCSSTQPPDAIMPQPPSGRLITRPECLAWCAPFGKEVWDCCQHVIELADDGATHTSECTWSQAFALTR